MICGIGVDLVDMDRFARHLERTPALRHRLFTERERALPDHSLAARFAAKEALIKALGGSEGISWQDLEIVRGKNRAPSFSPTSGLIRVLNARGIGVPWVSLAHESNMAVATVVLESAVGEQIWQEQTGQDPVTLALGKELSDAAGTIDPTEEPNEGTR